MKYLQKLKQLITNDKFLHFVFGLAIAALMYPFGEILAFITACVFACGKELLDYKGMGTSDLSDALATVLGASFLLFWYDWFAVFTLV